MLREGVSRCDLLCQERPHLPQILLTLWGSDREGNIAGAASVNLCPVSVLIRTRDNLSNTQAVGFVVTETGRELDASLLVLRGCNLLHFA